MRHQAGQRKAGLKNLLTSVSTLRWFFCRSIKTDLDNSFAKNAHVIKIHHKVCVNKRC